MSKYMSGAELLAAMTLRTEEIAVPGFPKPVRVRQLSLRDKSEIDKRAASGASNAEIAPLICSRCVIDENGVRQFDEKQFEDLMDNGDPNTVVDLATKIVALSNVTTAQVESAEKNSGSIPSDGSSSV